jgi:hypothetical protein
MSTDNSTTSGCSALLAGRRGEEIAGIVLNDGIRISLLRVIHGKNARFALSRPDIQPKEQ